MRLFKALGITGLLILVAATSSPAKRDKAQESEASPVDRQIAGCERLAGPLTVFLDRKQGKVWLELPAASDDGEPLELLYTESLLTGLGSNPVGLDRGQLGETRWVRFRRIGPRLLIEQPNLAYRAQTENPDEARAVAHSFATSVLWSGEVTAEDPDGRAIVDFTPFLVRDAHQVVQRLRDTDQGSFSLSSERSLVDLDRSLAFPNNLELEAILTFSGQDAGRHVRSTTPDPSAITLVQHHSFVSLPEPGYQPRRLDPRAGSFGIDFLDYAVPLDASMSQQWLVRHRLEKSDPTAESSPVVEPIVYYVDSGAPEPIRSALIEGASWWAAAFEAAGFEDAFRVEILPEGAHPLDVRYNVIQWVHRSTRGWSYGGGVIDPRTGEMLKGHVSLGSLRVRQDIRIFEGLLGVDGTGKGGAEDPVELALARIRQLSAHEVGHTLGFAHNFAASTYGRASVMDYPAPWVVATDDGGLDVRGAYGVGVGTWDYQTVRYAYSQFAPGTEERSALAAIVADGIAKGLLFLSDADSRAPGSAHPLANLWDNGEDPVEELANVLEVRRRALDAFGVDRVAMGRPMAELEEVLAPIYFYHRFQVEAAARAIGGLEYSYSMRGDGQTAPRPVAASRQWRALELLLQAVHPSTLDLPESLLARLTPRPFSYGYHRELFDTRTRPGFDALGAAGSASDLVLSFVLQPERMARLVDHHRRDADQPALEDLLGRVIDTVFDGAVEETPRRQELRRVLQRVLVDRLIAVFQSPTGPEVGMRLRAAAENLSDRLAAEVRGLEGAHRRALRADLLALLEAPVGPRTLRPTVLDLPPGSPIGQNRGWSAATANGGMGCSFE